MMDMIIFIYGNSFRCSQKEDMLKSISDELTGPLAISLNRYVDMSLVFFNSFVALIMLVGPWYICEYEVTFPEGSDCVIPAGTVVVPFVSTFCDKELKAMEVGGDEWADMFVYVFVYFVVALLSSSVVCYEVVSFGIRQWSNANTLGFAMQLGLLIIQTIILIKSDALVKPEGVDDTTAQVLVTAAVALSAARIVTLAFFMYLTKRYNNGTGSWLGTGAYI